MLPGLKKRDEDFIEIFLQKPAEKRERSVVVLLFGKPFKADFKVFAQKLLGIRFRQTKFLDEIKPGERVFEMLPIVIN